MTTIRAGWLRRRERQVLSSHAVPMFIGRAADHPDPGPDPGPDHDPGRARARGSLQKASRASKTG